MKVSQTVSNLKRKAKQAARDEGLPLHAALNRIAKQEGYSAWSLLASNWAKASTVKKLYATFQNGDTVLVGARPRQGKTMLCLALAAEAMRAGRSAVVFTLDSTEHSVRACLHSVDEHADQKMLEVDCSDAICAKYIESKLANTSPGTVVVVDFLQALDQRRENAPLQRQIENLKALSVRRGLIMVFISQIARSFDPNIKPFPDKTDVRLPNPVDLSLFDRAYFMQAGEVSSPSRRT